MLLLASLTVLLTPSELVVPKATIPVSIDGVVKPEEWKDALRIDIGSSRWLYLKHDSVNVLVAFQTKDKGLASIHVLDGSSVRVVHASAALGTALYANRDGGWKVAQPFTFACRKTDNSQDAINERLKFFQDHRWIANVWGQGTDGHREFQIDAKLVGQNPIVFAYNGFGPTPKLTSQPAKVDDDGLSERLANGFLDENLKFTGAKWSRLKLAR